MRYPLNHIVVRIRDETTGKDALGNPVVDPNDEVVSVAGWAIPSSSEPVLAGHDRRVVQVQLFAPPGVFESGDRVAFPDRDEELEVLGEPLSYEANPFMWSPGLVVVQLGGVE